MHWEDRIHDCRRGNASKMSARDVQLLILVHELLGVLPDLRGVSAKGEPETDEV